MAQECRLTFAATGSPLKDYQNTEIQTWEITAGTSNPPTYSYRWSTTGSGSAFNIDHTDWSANWTLNGSGSSTMTIAPAGGLKEAKTDDDVSVVNAVIGKEILLGTGTPKITDIKQTWNEYDRARQALAGAPRIEGEEIDVPLDPSWAPGGTGPLMGRWGTYSCRWSWPGA